jgi:hypothetical protein
MLDNFNPLRLGWQDYSWFRESLRATVSSANSSLTLLTLERSLYLADVQIDEKRREVRQAQGRPLTWEEYSEEVTALLT